MIGWTYSKCIAAFGTVIALLLVDVSYANGSSRSESEAVKFVRHVVPTPRYSKVETRSLYVTMRDGVRLAVDVSLPAPLKSDAALPTILYQTCYFRAFEFRWPIGIFIDRPPGDFHATFVELALSQGYAVVEVDVRGTGASYGFQLHPWSGVEIADARELVDWIVDQPWSNDRVGGYGNSYSGTTAELLAVTGHPAVRAIVTRFNEFDLYADMAFPGGVFNDYVVKNWGEITQTLNANRIPPVAGLLGRIAIRGVKPVIRGDAGRSLAEAVLQHRGNGDIYALSRGLIYRDDIDARAQIGIGASSVHLHREAIEASGIPIFTWGSWLDASTADGVLRRFLNYSNPMRAVIGAWNHGGELSSSPYAANSETTPSLSVQAAASLDFFDRYLRDGQPGVDAEAGITYFTMGDERWKFTRQWPPANQRRVRWLLGPAGSLHRERHEAASAFDEYLVRFDVTTGTDNRWHTEIDRERVEYGDRSSEDAKLLTYTSDPLARDLEITGYPVVSLHLSSTAKDGALHVYLEEVGVDGRSRYLTEGRLRVLHRAIATDRAPYRVRVPVHSFERANGAPLEPGRIAELRFGLLPTSVKVRKGQRLRIAIAGHDQGNFARIPPEGTPTIRIWRDAKRPSFLELPIIDRPANEALPW